MNQATLFGMPLDNRGNVMQTAAHSQPAPQARDENGIILTPLNYGDAVHNVMTMYLHARGRVIDIEYAEAIANNAQQYMMLVDDYQHKQKQKAMLAVEDKAFDKQALDNKEYARRAEQDPSIPQLHEKALTWDGTYTDEYGEEWPYGYKQWPRDPRTGKVKIQIDPLDPSSHRPVFDEKEHSLAIGQKRERCKRLYECDVKLSPDDWDDIKQYHGSGRYRGVHTINALLKAASEFPIKSHWATELGVTEKTLDNWRTKFPDFGTALDFVETSSKANLERIWYKLAAKGKVRPDMWAKVVWGVVDEQIVKQKIDQKVEHSGPVNVIRSENEMKAQPPGKHHLTREQVESVWSQRPDQVKKDEHSFRARKIANKRHHDPKTGRFTSAPTPRETAKLDAIKDEAKQRREVLKERGDAV